MKSTIHKTEAFLVLFMLMNYAFVVLEARPLSIIDTGNSATREFETQIIETLGGIKDSGPSAGGVGHKFTNSETLGGIKDSGPSPGQGHK